eukprot:6186459-Pleurochrysis_carterae.AAC.5
MPLTSLRAHLPARTPACAITCLRDHLPARSHRLQAASTFTTVRCTTNTKHASGITHAHNKESALLQQSSDIGMCALASEKNDASKTWVIMSERAPRAHRTVVYRTVSSRYQTTYALARHS